MNNKDQVKALIDAYLSTLWECGDCGNLYENTVDYCPNRNYDEFMLSGILSQSEDDAQTDKPKPYVNATVTMSSSSATAFCSKCGENWHGTCSYGESDDPLVITIADALFDKWFGGLTVDDLKQRNSYNGEYEIAIEDAKITVAAGYEHLGFQRR